jgi:hypothetical protein
MSQGESGQTATAPATSQPTRQYQASQPGFLAGLIFAFILSAFVFENPVREREASELAAPAHAAPQENPGQMAFITTIV